VVIASFPDLCVRHVGSSLLFYRSLLDLDVVVDHGWYAELGVGARTMIAFVVQGHETVPTVTSVAPAGVLVSFVVEDAAAIAARAIELGCRIVWPLTTELGQRHIMVADPDGAVVDAIQRVPLSATDRRRLVRLRREHAGTAAVTFRDDVGDR
jgi:catechol 2,3-dioxygenase-like lactoylglutathione lyase family enzyme